MELHESDLRVRPARSREDAGTRELSLRIDYSTLSAIAWPTRRDGAGEVPIRSDLLLQRDFTRA